MVPTGHVPVAATPCSFPGTDLPDKLLFLAQSKGNQKFPSCKPWDVLDDKSDLFLGTSGSDSLHAYSKPT